MRPPDTRRDPQCQKNKPNRYRLEADRVARLERWQFMKDGAEPLVPEFSFLNDVHQAGPKGYEECRIGEHYQAGVDWQDYARQGLAHFVGSCRRSQYEPRDRGQNEYYWKDKRAQGGGFVPPLSDNVTDYQAPGQECGHLLAADYRTPAGDQSPIEQPGGLGAEADTQRHQGSPIE